jgi:hypothetical protein
MSGILGSISSSALRFNLEYLVIAGGGPGGVAIGSLTNTGTGGGGAGGYLTATGFSSESSKLYTITVGAGASSNGFEIGSNSVFGSVTALGGGGGGSPSAPNGKSGGSGGGAGYPSAGGASLGGSAPIGQGNPGGNANGGGASGGGGGAGGVGGSGSGTTPGAAGIGAASTITGTSITRSRGGAGRYSAVPVGNAAAAGENTGDGGDGGVNNRASSGWGGSGVVILRYPDTLPNMIIGFGLAIDDGSNGNVSGSGTRLSPSFTPSGFKVYRFKSGTGNVSW